MNTSRLLEIIEKLLDVEKTNQLQQVLNGVLSVLGNMVNQPTQAAHQNAYMQALVQLQKVDEATRLAFQPSQRNVLEEIGASPYFIDNISGTFQKIVQDNAATLSVAHNKMGALINERQNYLGHLQQLQQNLTQMGFKANGLEPGQAEIGFLLPRELFQNEFEHLLIELQVVRRIIRAFSEVATGSSEPIELRQISTSDPLFVFGLSPHTIEMIGAAIAWALHTWKQVEQIRQLRSQASKIPALEDGAIADMLEKKIKQHIEDALQQQTGEILTHVRGDHGRKHEQTTQIRWALESIVARIERGLSVEIRFLPPPPSKKGDGQDASTPQSVFAELDKIGRELEFPRIEGTNILKLPPDKPDDDKVEKNNEDR